MYYTRPKKFRALLLFLSWQNAFDNIYADDKERNNGKAETHGRRAIPTV